MFSRTTNSSCMHLSHSRAHRQTLHRNDAMYGATLRLTVIYSINAYILSTQNNKTSSGFCSSDRGPILMIG